MKRKIITGLDIGTSKVCATIAELKENGELSILGAGLAPCSVLSEGVVSDLDKLTDSVASALETAEDKAKVKAHNVFANAGGIFVKGNSYDGAFLYSTTPRAVIKRDVNKVINIAKDLSVSLGEDPIHLIPLIYSLDNQEGIENPLGLYGAKLKVRLYIITCASNIIKNIAKAISHAGYEMADIIYSGIATSCVLSDEEKSDGVALMDMGSHTTELVIFSKGKIRFNAALDFGGQDITEEISSHFKIPKRVAEDLKIRYGTIHERDLSIEFSAQDFLEKIKSFFSKAAQWKKYEKDISDHSKELDFENLFQAANAIFQNEYKDSKCPLCDTPFMLSGRIFKRTGVVVDPRKKTERELKKLKKLTDWKNEKERLEVDLRGSSFRDIRDSWQRIQKNLTDDNWKNITGGIDKPFIPTLNFIELESKLEQVIKVFIEASVVYQ